MGREENSMLIEETGTRPSRQARGRVQESRDIVTHDKWSGLAGLLMLAAVPFCVIVVPRLMWLALAPIKGWC